MTTDDTDPTSVPDRDEFAFDDAPYLIGALDADRRAAFEAHLQHCPACRARVREVADVPLLLARAGGPAELGPFLLDPAAVESAAAQPEGARAEDVPAGDGRAGDRPPADLLPALLRAARQERRRRRVLAGGLAVAACAAAIAVGVALAPSSPGTGSGSDHTNLGVARAHRMMPFGVVPITASAALVSRNWGTQIVLHCREIPARYAVPGRYVLVVIARDGSHEDLGSWSQGPRGVTDFRAGTELRPAQIADVLVTRRDGTRLLQLHM